MKPQEAADFLFAMSNLAPINKPNHVRCEEAKAVLDVALKQLEELVCDRKKNPSEQKG